MTRRQAMAEMGTALVHNSSFYATTIAAELLMVRLGSIMRHIELHLLARTLRTR